MRKALTLAAVSALILLARPSFAQQFVVPSPAHRQAAIGSVKGLPLPLQKALSTTSHFSAKSKPGVSDWLANHTEAGQTWAQYKGSRPNLPAGKRNVIYLQPIGAFKKDSSPDLMLLVDYTARFYMMPVRLLDPLPLKDGAYSPRINGGSRKTQILTTDIMKELSQRLPDDAYCLLGITMVDLYPDPKWNFVFGQASLRNRVGVYSFARYDPVFYGQERDKDYMHLILERSCKVLTHETCHMFGVRHCIYFECLMNGSNHLDESDAQPQTLCPVCLRKLHYATGSDVVLRYEGLAEFYKEQKFKDEGEWVDKRLKAIK